MILISFPQCDCMSQRPKWEKEMNDFCITGNQSLGSWWLLLLFGGSEQPCLFKHICEMFDRFRPVVSLCVWFFFFEACFLGEMHPSHSPFWFNAISVFRRQQRPALDNLFSTGFQKITSCIMHKAVLKGVVVNFTLGLNSPKSGLQKICRWVLVCYQNSIQWIRKRTTKLCPKPASNRIWKGKLHFFFLSFILWSLISWWINVTYLISSVLDPCTNAEFWGICSPQSFSHT